MTSRDKNAAFIMCLSLIAYLVIIYHTKTPGPKQTNLSFKEGYSLISEKDYGELEIHLKPASVEYLDFEPCILTVNHQSFKRALHNKSDLSVFTERFKSEVYVAIKPTGEDLNYLLVFLRLTSKKVQYGFRGYSTSDSANERFILFLINELEKQHPDQHKIFTEAFGKSPKSFDSL